jgi:hypothetical protein
MQVIGYGSGIKLGNRLDLSTVGGRAQPPVWKSGVPERVVHTLSRVQGTINPYLTSR